MQSNGPDLSSRSPAQQQQQQQQQQSQQIHQWPPHMQHPHHNHQPWMAGMQYPAAAMVMMQQQHQMMMMYPQQHYMAAAYYQQQQQYHNQHQQPTQMQNGGGYRAVFAPVNEEAKTIWVGDLVHWMDETYLHTCFNQNNQVSSVKVIRNKQTGQSEGYGFVEFSSHETAEKVLQSYNGAQMPNSDQLFRLNWASFAVDRRAESGSELSVFVGDLAADVTDTLLQETFSGKYPSVRGVKVVVDPNSGRSKGYGFVRFGDENERAKAITEMNGVYCSSRPMRLGIATPKKAPMHQQHYSSQAVVLSGGHGSNGVMVKGPRSDEDMNNTTIFVGGIDSDASDEDLRQPFSQFGEIVSIKIPAGKGCGFVQFAIRKNAEEALESLNGTVIGSQTVRLSWGRSPANKHWRGDHNSQWNGAPYNGYAYGVSPGQDPNMYAATAAASGAS